MCEMSGEREAVEARARERFRKWLKGHEQKFGPSEIEALLEQEEEQIAMWVDFSLAENAELLAWKQSAMEIMSPLQDIGKELSVRLGDSIHDKILPAIQRLNAKKTAAEAEVVKLREALAGSRKAHDDEGHAWNLLNGQLKAEVVKLREAAIKAAMPLEAILLAVDWELSPEVMTAVKEGVKAIRSALNPGAAKEETSGQ
jgi:hypothetical protein